MKAGRTHRSLGGLPLRGVQLGLVQLGLLMGALACGASPQKSQAPSAAPVRHEAAGAAEPADDTAVWSGKTPRDDDPLDMDKLVLESGPLETVEDAERALGMARKELDSVFSASAEELSAARRCARACRAFASLQRSAGRLCELAGEDNERCVSARQVVSDNRDRIEAASCRC